VIPYKFKALMERDEMYPAGWCHRKFFAPRRSDNPAKQPRKDEGIVQEVIQEQKRMEEARRQQEEDSRQQLQQQQQEQQLQQHQSMQVDEGAVEVAAAAASATGLTGGTTD
jgi:hypothetical protein